MTKKFKSLFTRPNKVINSLLALILLLGPLVPAASAAKAPAVSGSSYYLTYTTASSGKLYAYKDASLKTKTGGWIACSTDECRIIAVSGNAVKVSYPAGSTRKEAWFPRSSFTAFDLAKGDCSSVTSPAKITTYRWSSGSSTAGYIAAGDAVRILCTSGSRTQVIYPVGKNYRMAWVNTSDVTKYLKSTSTSSSSTSSSSSAANVANGKYVLASGLNGNMVADIDGNKTTNGANCHLYTYNGTSAQIFQITHVSNGWYKIAHTGSGKVLDVSGGIKAPCVNVQIYQYNGSNAQLWKFVPTSGGYYIVNKLGYYLDVSGGTAKDSTNIWVYSGNGTKAQVWSLRSVSTTTSSSSSDTWKEPMKNYYVCGNDWSEYYAPKAAKGRPDHAGVDIKSRSGNTAVVAAADGTVVDFGNNSDNGMYVLLKHTLSGKTVYSFYTHLQSYNSFTRGDSVKQGTVLGDLGKDGTTGSSSTGNHLHFAVFSCTGTPKQGGGFVGYVQSFTGNKVTYGSYTFYSPRYVLEKNSLPG